jgi:hypothetical protein
MRPFLTIFRWIQGLPRGWIRANVHPSLLLTLGLIAGGSLAVGYTHQGFTELKPLALTLPIVWVVSLAVRIAAQHFAIGADSIEMHTKLGPTGNLSTDYEFLRPWQIFRYAIAGQAATISLLSIGGLVCAVLLPVGNSSSSWMTLVEPRGGWDSLAWATQIIWVNALVFALNLLPTIPFDNRALLYSLAMLHRRHEEAKVLRRLAGFNSHLAFALLGVSLAVFAISSTLELQPMGWYLFAAAGVYLLVSSRWEVSRAAQLEEQCVSFGAARVERRSRRSSGRQPKREPVKESEDTVPASAFHPVDAEDQEADSVTIREPRMHVSEAYLDEILRKLHREGTAALSVREQEALLTASQKLKEKHRTK